MLEILKFLKLQKEKRIEKEGGRVQEGGRQGRVTERRGYHILRILTMNYTMLSLYKHQINTEILRKAIVGASIWFSS